MGDIRWEILFYLFVAWVLVYMVIWRGLHQSGKIIWVTATFPYLILFILFIRGVTLEGASKGLWFYITPNWKKLAEAKVRRVRVSHSAARKHFLTRSHSPRPSRNQRPTKHD